MLRLRASPTSRSNGTKKSDTNGMASRRYRPSVAQSAGFGTATHRCRRVPAGSTASPSRQYGCRCWRLYCRWRARKNLGNHGKLDHIVIMMAHPDATIAMLTAQRDVTANFSAGPFQYRQQKQASIRQLMTSADILGGPVAFNVLATTTKLRTEHPKHYAALLVASRKQPRWSTRTKRGRP